MKMKMKTRKRRFSQEHFVTKKRPTAPLVLQSGITVINGQTSVQDASLWSLQLDELYTQYYGASCVVWTWDDMHALDHEAMVELEEVLRASRNPPLDADLVSSFMVPTWRRPYDTKIGISPH